MANFQLQDSQKVPYAVLLTDADGNPTAPAAGDSVVVASADAASATVAADAAPDPAKAPAGSSPLQTGFIVGGAKLAAGLKITATITLANPPKAGQPAPIVDLVDIVGGPSANGSITLGTPVAQ